MRYERKYQITNHDPDVLHQVLLTMPLGLYEKHPLRVVQNIYFDSYDWDSWFENVAGIAKRTKFRLRWYGESDCWQKARFEYKKKQNMLGQKEIRPIPSGCRLDFLKNTPNFIDSNFKAVLWNSYQRRYLESFDKKIRITLDYDMKFGAPDLPYSSMMTPLEDIWVMELKYDETLEDEVAQIGQILQYRPDKFSKFVYGMEIVYGM